ncbi:hypothetical protein Tco_0555637 [Tanacetum coccineum]
MIYEEQRAQITRDEEIARQWDEEERQRAMAESKSAKKIDWNDPSVIRYHTQKMKPKTVAQARKNMIKYLKNQGNYKISDFKGMSYNDIRPIFEKIWDLNQNFEPMEHETETMKSPEKSPEKMKSGEKMDAVKKQFCASRLEGFDLMLWGDLYVLFESDEEDEIWKSQDEYNLISWRLCDLCGIHILLMENGLAIHMAFELLRVMSSPNHPTSDIEDAFSSNFLDYIPASPDYVPASPGKTYSSSSNNSFGVVLIVSPTLSLFHDDPYMKVMHAYYAKESPIPPPTIVPPSTMPSSMFNPQEFFLPKE